MNPFRNLFRKGRSNLLKIICLAFGITAGLMLIAKVHFESSYDTYFPDNERVYQLRTYVTRTTDGEDKEYGQISGGVAPGMMAEIPEVEAATRMTLMFDPETKFKIGDEDKIKMNLILADSLWFDVFSTKVLIGDPRQVLGKPLVLMVSRSVAEKLGGVESAIGKTIVPEGYDDWKLTVEGVYEDCPENSTLRYDALTSIYAFPKWSLENWLGNDRYMGFVKLRENVVPSEVVPKMRKVQEKHVDLSQLEESGLDLSYGLMRMAELHREDAKVRNLNNMMLLVAAVMIVIAVLNYILIVLSSFGVRVKEIAVRKCYGISGRGIVGIVAEESLVNLILALLLGVVMAFAFKDMVEGILEVSYEALFTPASLAILLGIIGVILLITVCVPSFFFMRIPVTGAFRRLRSSRGIWKKSLLFVEFAGAAYVAVMLMNITRQYNYMMDYDLGYEVDNLLYANLSTLEKSQREAIVSEISRLPQVEGVAMACSLPISMQSGNNVSLPGDYKELFNYTDLYFVTDGWFETMGVPVIEGNGFHPGESNERNEMVRRSFVDKMRTVASLEDSPIGWEFIFSEHSKNESDRFKVVGVFEDMKVGTAQGFDERPQVIFHDNPNNELWLPGNVVVRLGEISSENIAAVNQAIRKVVPDAELMAESYRLLVNQSYTSDRNLRDSLVACCIIALVITLAGLIGYVSDMLNSRRREIAIRKVNGADTSDIMKMLIRKITMIALPSMSCGAILGWISTESWLSNYPQHISQSVPLTILSMLVIYLIVFICVIIRAHRSASENPIKALYQN